MSATGPQGVRQVPFAVSGASGAVGGRAVSRLAELGLSQRLIVRDRSRAPALPGAEAAEASYDDPEAMLRALLADSSGRGFLESWLRFIQKRSW